MLKSTASARSSARATVRTRRICIIIGLLAMFSIFVSYMDTDGLTPYYAPEIATRKTLLEWHRISDCSYDFRVILARHRNLMKVQLRDSGADLATWIHETNVRHVPYSLLVDNTCDFMPLLAHNSYSRMHWRLREEERFLNVFVVVGANQQRFTLILANT